MHDMVLLLVPIFTIIGVGAFSPSTEPPPPSAYPAELEYISVSPPPEPGKPYGHDSSERKNYN